MVQLFRFENEEAPSLLARIDEAARGLGEKYVQVKVFRQGSNKPEAVKWWDVPEPEDYAPEDTMTGGEMVNGAAAGLLRQAYQHNEFFATQMIRLGETLNLNLQVQQKMMTEQIAVMRKENHEQARQIADRDYERAELQQKTMREAAVINGFSLLSQALAVRFAGPMENNNPHVAAVAQLFNSFTPEQVQRLLPILSQDQMVLLASLNESAAEGKPRQPSPPPRQAPKPAANPAPNRPTNEVIIDSSANVSGEGEAT